MKAKKSSITAKESKGNWIGFQDLDQDLEFEWTDGTPVLYAHWGKDSPVRHAGDNMACAYLNNGGVWVLSNCDDSRYSVCKRDQEIVAVADTPEGCAEVSDF